MPLHKGSFQMIIGRLVCEDIQFKNTFEDVSGNVVSGAMFF